MERSSRRLAVLTALLAMGRMHVMAGDHVRRAGRGEPARRHGGRAVRGDPQRVRGRGKNAQAEAEKGKTEFESSEDLPQADARRGGVLAADGRPGRDRPEGRSGPRRPALGARQAGHGAGGPYGDEFTRAVLLLLRHHADDPEVARVGLAARQRLLPRPATSSSKGSYVRAIRGREAKGLARLALAEYLKAKAGLRRRDPQCARGRSRRSCGFEPRTRPASSSRRSSTSRRGHSLPAPPPPLRSRRRSAPRRDGSSRR